MSNEVQGSKPFARPTKLIDCLQLSITMREEDRWEIWHAARSTPVDALTRGFEQSKKCWTVVWQGKPIAIFGVCGDGDVGVPWMLASDDLKNIKKEFLAECHKYVDEMQGDYKLLANLAWSKNTVHLRWLKWLGFTLMEPQPFGPDGELFIYFYRNK